MLMLRRSGVLALAAAIFVVAPAPETTAGEWELEINAGGLFTLTPSGGRRANLPRGESFQTVVPGVSSHRVSSWFFGEGSVLLRQRLPYIRTSFGYSFHDIAIVGPLDDLLSSAAVEWPFEAGVGLRLGRRLGRRLTAEVNVEYSPHVPTFSESARSAIERSRSAFETAWGSTLSSLPGAHVTSRTTLGEGSGRQIVATGVLNVHLQTGDPPRWSRRTPRRRFVSYVSLGAGVISTEGEEASATVVGRYQFASPPGEPAASFEETDAVTVRSSRTFRTAFVGVVGLGWKQDLSTRWGIRFDARAYLSRNPERIVMDARPSVANGSPTLAFVTDSRIGAIQFVNSSSGTEEGHQSSLSGPAITGFETFRGTGIRTQIRVTLGVFLRL
jgi:hypothetical protein